MVIRIFSCYDEGFYCIDGKSLTGTARYASLNTHIGHEQARRDDIESIAFVMIYFIKGKLPWQGVSGKNKEEKYKKIKERKIDTPITELSRGLPPQFLKFFELVRNIGFEDAPDYAALRTLLADMFTEKNYENDFMYDWVIKSQEHSKKSRVHSQERKNEFNKPKNNYKGRNEQELQHHKNGVGSYARKGKMNSISLKTTTKVEMSTNFNIIKTHIMMSQSKLKTTKTHTSEIKSIANKSKHMTQLH